MGMFDWYEPSGSIACPVCGNALVAWQGKDGVCALVVWQQGVAAPIRQDVDPDVRVDDAVLNGWRLPPEFWISSDDCRCRYQNVAIGRCEHGVWTTTELITAANARQLSHQTRAEWKSYRAWLQGS